MEGNDIEDLGGGSFRTVAAVQRYSLLDQYAMGLVRDSRCRRSSTSRARSTSSPNRRAEIAPQVGVTFNGTRRDVLIQDVIAVHGAARAGVRGLVRESTARRSSAVVSAGRQPDAGQVDKIDRIRRQWETFFQQATDGRMQADTRLR